NLEKVAQDLVAVLRCDALGMELHRVDRQGSMHKAHDNAVRSLRRDLERRRNTGRSHRQGMVAGRAETRRDARKDATPRMADLADLSVHWNRSADDLAAKNLPDRLMPEAYPQNRDHISDSGHQVEANASLIRRTGPGRQHDRFRVHRHDLC